MTILKQVSLLALAACLGLVLVGCQPSDPNSPRVAEFTAIAVTPNPVTPPGNSTLTIGRGGIVNYDIARQTFTANLLLGDHQYWDGGAGGITISNLNSNGKLLEITGAGTNRITGNMSGTAAWP